MSPSGSRMQISGTAALGKFFWRRASRSKFSGAKTEGAAKSFPAKIGGNLGTMRPPKNLRSRIYGLTPRRDIRRRCGLVKYLAQNGARNIKALSVTPAKAGVQSLPLARTGGNRQSLGALDSRFRGNDE